MSLSKVAFSLLNRRSTGYVNKLIVRPQKPSILIANTYVLLKHYTTNNPGETQKCEQFTTISTVTQKHFEHKSFESETEATQDKAQATSLQSIKYSLIFLGVSLICIGSFVIVEFGKPIVDEEGFTVTDEFSELPIWQQYLQRCVKQIMNFALIIQQPSRDKLLPDEVQYPYYQPPYTLILEFTDLMVHPDWTYKTGWRFKKRPGLDYLLENLVGLFEIVIYTAEQGITVFPIIETLDPKNLITYKLVRDATHFVDGHHVKDLDKLNRNLNKVIVVDWNNESVKFHPENLLNIGRWDGNDEDQTMLDLTSFLKTIAVNEVDDVREVLRYYKQFDDPLAAFREKQREYLELQERQSKEKKKPKLNLFRW